MTEKTISTVKTMNTIHFNPIPNVPPNSPVFYRINGRPEYNADESESEEMYPDIDNVKEEGQGNSKPIVIPPKKDTQSVNREWGDFHFGD